MNEKLRQHRDKERRRYARAARRATGRQQRVGLAHTGGRQVEATGAAREQVLWQRNPVLADSFLSKVVVEVPYFRRIWAATATRQCTARTYIPSNTVLSRCISHISSLRYFPIIK